MKTSEQIASVAEALAKAHAEISSIERDGKNPHFKSRYATLDQILESVRPVLAKNGLIIVQGSDDTSDDHKYIIVKSSVIHSSGQWIETSVQVPVTKNDAHGLGSALTYGRRYSLGALLAISTQEADDDGNAAVKSMRKPQGIVQATASVSNASDLPTPKELALKLLEQIRRIYSNQEMQMSDARDAFIAMYGENASMTSETLLEAIATLSTMPDAKVFNAFVLGKVEGGVKGFE
jgi:hypothetical protein